MVRFLLLALVGASALPLLAREEAPKLDPAQPYKARAANPVTYEVDFSAVVTAPYHTKKLRVWLPIPQTDAGQEVTTRELSTFPLEVKPKIGTEKVYGNKFAYFEFDHPEGAQLIRHRFRIKVFELHWDIDATKVARVKDWPKSFGPYLRSDASVTVNEKISDLAKGVVKDSKGAAYDLDAVMDWLHQNMKYDHSKASLEADAMWAFEKRTGHCSDYHGLCASFGRALGVPTRVTYGINTFPKASPSHCKMEAYLPPYGWVSFDVSETQKLIHSIEKDTKLAAAHKARLIKAARARLKKGFRDNTWFLQTRGTDYDLEPLASRKVRVVRTIYAEADGKALKDPDPSDKTQTAFSWMTMHKYTPDRKVSYPFTDRSTLGK
jgi:transglutaminase-like putative cysteine protease